MLFRSRRLGRLGVLVVAVRVAEATNLAAVELRIAGARGPVAVGGVGRHGVGSITAIYTVLAEGDDGSDPIVDIARASLDGQVMLSRKLADAAHYPAIDLNGSISRVMQNLIDPQDQRLANQFRRLWSLYQQNQDLIQVGAYEAGSNPELDQAIRLREHMEGFLRQDMQEKEDAATTLHRLRELMS